MSNRTTRNKRKKQHERWCERCPERKQRTKEGRNQGSMKSKRLLVDSFKHAASTRSPIKRHAAINGKDIHRVRTGTSSPRHTQAVVSTNRPLAERMSPIDEPRRTIVRHEAKHTTMSPNTVSVQLFGSTKYKRQVDEKKENYICPQPDRHTQHRNEIRCGLVSRNIVRNTSANVLKAPHCKDDTT